MECRICLAALAACGEGKTDGTIGASLPIPRLQRIVNVRVMAMARVGVRARFGVKMRALRPA